MCDQQNCLEASYLKGKCKTHYRMICRVPACSKLKSMYSHHCSSHHRHQDVFDCSFVYIKQGHSLCYNHANKAKNMFGNGVKISKAKKTFSSSLKCSACILSTARALSQN